MPRRAARAASEVANGGFASTWASRGRTTTRRSAVHDARGSEARMSQPAQYRDARLDGESSPSRSRTSRKSSTCAARPPAAAHRPALLGMIDVRGQGYPVVDLRIRLGLPPARADAAPASSCSTSEASDARARVGLVADRVFEVTGARRGQLEPAAQHRRALARAIPSAASAGATTAFVMVLDLRASARRRRALPSRHAETALQPEAA